MKNKMTRIGLIILISLAAFGCSVMNYTKGSSNGTSNKTNVKGIPVELLCRIIEDPMYTARERRSDDCDAKFYFVAGNTPGYVDPSIPGFTFLSEGKDGMVHQVLLTMSRRRDAEMLQFFALEAGVVSRFIDEQPLPKEIESEIVSKSDGTSKKTVKTENAEFIFEELSAGTRTLEINTLQK